MKIPIRERLRENWCLEGDKSSQQEAAPSNFKHMDKNQRSLLDKFIDYASIAIVECMKSPSIKKNTHNENGRKRRRDNPIMSDCLR